MIQLFVEINIGLEAAIAFFQQKAITSLNKNLSA